MIPIDKSAPYPALTTANVVTIPSTLYNLRCFIYYFNTLQKQHFLKTLLQLYVILYGPIINLYPIYFLLFFFKQKYTWVMIRQNMIDLRS